jgi:hypothetical protein
VRIGLRRTVSLLQREPAAVVVVLGVAEANA